MIRKVEKIELDNGTKVTISELTVKDVIGVLDGLGALEEISSIKDAWGHIQGQILNHIEGLTKDEFSDLSFSELKIVYDTFKKVNTDFFALCQAAGVMTALERAAKALPNEMLASLSALSVDSSGKDIQKFGDTGTDFSEMPINGQSTERMSD